MAFKIKDGVRIGTVDVFSNTGTLLVNAPSATTAGKVNNALSTGSGLTGGPYDGSAAITISHADTSNATNLTANGRTYVTGLTFDAFGHVTAYTTGTETVTDTNTTYTLDGSGTANSVNLELIAGGSGSGTDSVNIIGSGGTTVSWDEANQRITINSTGTTYSQATSTAIGLIKLGSDTQQTVAANAVSATANRTYATQVNASGQLLVNVPWTDTTYSKATSTTLGLVELFDNAVQTTAANAVTTTANRTYGIQLNSADQAVVNVPWTDTTYSQATSSVLGLVKLGSDTQQTVAANAVSTTASRSYAVQVNASGQLLVNVPWTDTDTNTDTLQSIASDTANADRYITTVASATGAQTGLSHSTLVYNPATETLKVTNLIVSGTSTTINTETINLADNIILLNSNATGAATENAGIEIERGTDPNKTLLWDETADTWTIGSEKFVAGSLEVGGKVTTSIVTGTLSASTATAIDTWATGTYRSAVYQIQLAQGSKYQFGEVRVMHDSNGVAYVTEFAVLENSTIGTGTQPVFTATIVGGILSLNILVDNAATTNVTYIIERKLFAV